MKAGTLLAEALSVSGVDPRDVLFVMADLMHCDPLELSLLRERELGEDVIKKFWEYHARLARHEPPQYILGKSWFYGLEFEVSPAVLVPRPETEGLVELALGYLHAGTRVLEIGTGSGAISIVLKKHVPGAVITATDASSDALALARRNAAKHDCALDLQLGDLFPAGEGRFGLMISNPPYVSASEYRDLEPRVRNFEPRSALLAEEDGLIYYRRILERAADRLAEQGLIFFEHGALQREGITTLARERGFECILSGQDLAGRNRYLVLQQVAHNPADQIDRILE